MCTKLRELEEALATFAGDFDAALLPAAEAEGVMERAARIEHMGATLKALAAARLAETELWRVGGDRTPAHMLARRTGQSVSDAARERDHREDWARTHRTPFDGMDGHCDHHHDKKTYEGWALVEGTGKRPFVPPDDPRHPRHAGKASERPPRAAA